MTQTVTEMRGSFNGGEVSRRLQGRVDTGIYKVAAATVENFVLTVEGPIVKAPGFRYIRPAAAGATWLSRFVFSRTQSYVIEWSEATLRFFTNGGRIETDATHPYELAVPYSAAEASEISRQQSYDRQYLAHANHPPAALTRTGAETFAYAALALANGPFDDQNSDETITATATGDLTVGGTVTVTVSSAIFAGGDVGGLFQLQAQDFSTINAWEAGIAISSSTMPQCRSDGKAYTYVSGDRTGSVPPTHTEGTENDGSRAGTDVNDNGPYGCAWEYRHDRFGIIRITAVAVDGLSCTGIVLRRLPDSLQTVASWRWSWGAFSTRRGWPNAVVIWNQRLVLIKLFDIYASVVGDYLNHSAFTSSGLVAADLAFHYRLAASDPILWVVADLHLVVGTASGVYPIGAVNTAAAPGPGNIGLSRPTFYGASGVQPLQLGTDIHFVQNGGRRVREGSYSFQSDAMVASNITVWARQMTASGVKQLCYLQQPEELLIALRNDGQLAMHAYSPEQEVKGWSRRIHAAGAIVSAETIPADDGADDELWALVQDGAGNLSIEQMQPFFDEDETAQADQFFVDSGITATFDSPVSHVSGLPWLIGQGVAVLADGAVVTDKVVAGDGTLDLPFAARVITIGHGFTARLVSLPVEAQTQSGTAQGKLKKLVNAILRLISTGTGLFAGTADGTLDEILSRTGSDRMDAPIPLFDGDTDNVSIGGGFDRNGQYEIVHSDPTNCNVSAIMPRFEVSEK